MGLYAWIWGRCQKRDTKEHWKVLLVCSFQVADTRQCRDTKRFLVGWSASLPISRSVSCLVSRSVTGSINRSISRWMVLSSLGRLVSWTVGLSICKIYLKKDILLYRPCPTDRDRGTRIRPYSVLLSSDLFWRVSSLGFVR